MTRPSLKASEVEAHIAAVTHFLDSRKIPVAGAGALSGSKESDGLLDSQKRMSILQLRGDTFLVCGTILFVFLTSGIGATLIGLVLWKRLITLFS